MSRPWTVRGFSPVTIENESGVLARALDLLARPAWEVTVVDVDRMAGTLAAEGMASSTRRGYVQSFKGFHRFLQARKAGEIEAVFGVRLSCPVDEFNASRHVEDDSPALLPPPTPARLEEFFDFMKGRIATARKYGPAARTMPCSARCTTPGRAPMRPRRWRSPTCTSLGGRSGSCMSGSGRARVLLVRGRGGCRCSDGLDLVLRWYLTDVRGRFPDTPVLFADESGGPLHRGTIRNRLRYLMTLEGKPASEWFSPHAMRRACATHNYERGVDLVAIQQMLGHWTADDAVRAPVGHIHRGRVPSCGQ